MLRLKMGDGGGGNTRAALRRGKKGRGDDFPVEVWSSVGGHGHWHWRGRSTNLAMAPKGALASRLRSWESAARGTWDHSETARRHEVPAAPHRQLKARPGVKELARGVVCLCTVTGGLWGLGTLRGACARGP